MKEALERHSTGSIHVLPIIVRSALWEESPLASLKALMKEAKLVKL